jgi:Nucleotidyl transferase AbiEii toxin, Type IV TA system
MNANTTVSVLETINAPHRDYLGAEEIVGCLRDMEKSKIWAGHMSSFFGEVSPELQRSFAIANGIELETLAAAARAFSSWSGQTFVLAAWLLSRASNWQVLLGIARALIDQVNLHTTVIDRWTLGGGTALMLQIGHRESCDIDIFLDDPQLLGFLDPA